MFSKIFLTLVILYLCALLSSQVCNGDSDLKKKLEEEGFDCKKATARVGKKAFKALSKCSKQFKEADPEYDFENKFDCVVRCVFKDFNMLHDDMTMSEESFDKFLGESVPEALHAATWALFGKCIEDHSTKLDPKDEYCKSYGEMFKCLQNTFESFKEEHCPDEE